MIAFYGREDYPEFVVGEKAVDIDNLMELPEGTSIVVLFAQPTDSEVVHIRDGGITIFAHEGLRVECSKFTTVSLMQSLISSELKAREDKKVREFLKGLQALTEEEREFIEREYGYGPDFFEDALNSNAGLWSKMGGIFKGGAFRGSLKGGFFSGGSSIGGSLRNESLSALEDDVIGYSGRLISFRGSGSDFKRYLQSLEKRTKNKRLLLIDGDLFSPSFDSLFKIKQINTREKTHLTGRDNTGINVALDLLDRGYSIDEALSRTAISIGKKKSVLLGNYNIFNLDSYDVSKVQTLVSGVLQRFDIVIVKLSNFIYDELAMAITHMADFNVFAVGEQIHQLRYAHQFFEMLLGRQGISQRKIGIYSQRQGGVLFTALFGDSYRGGIRSSAKALRRMLK